MGTKLNPAPSDCYANALDDEPYFTLIARDPDAPEVARYWATLREARIGRGEKPESDGAMIGEARECASEMAAWREENRMITVHVPRQEPFVGPRWHYEKATPLSGLESARLKSNRAIKAQLRAEIDVLQNRVSRATIERDETMGALAAAEQRVEIAESSITTMEQRAVRAEDRAEAAERTIKAWEDEAQARVAGRTPETTLMWPLVGTVPAEVRRSYKLPLDYPTCRFTPEQAETRTVEELTRQADESVESFKKGTLYPELLRREIAEDKDLGSSANPIRIIDRALSEFQDDDLVTIYAGSIRECLDYQEDHIHGLERQIKGLLPESQPVEENGLFESEDDMPDHRFRQFVKHEDYAWARGLNVAPMHLPKALHEMEHEFGWVLLAIFGDPEPNRIGFIFKKTEHVDVDLGKPGTVWPEQEMTARIVPHPDEDRHVKAFPNVTSPEQAARQHRTLFERTVKAWEDGAHARVASQHRTLFERMCDRISPEPTPIVMTAKGLLPPLSAPMTVWKKVVFADIIDSESVHAIVKRFITEDETTGTALRSAMKASVIGLGVPNLGEVLNSPELTARFLDELRSIYCRWSEQTGHGPCDDLGRGVDP